MDPETKNAATPPKAYFKFLELPPELRNMIYEFALVEDQPTFISCYYKCPNMRPRGFGLLLVCKQIYEEGLSILFGMNTISFFSVEDMAMSLKSLGKFQRDLIRSVYFDLRGKSRSEGIEWLADCANLRSLKIEVHSLPTQGGFSRVNGVKQLLKVRGCSEVTVSFTRSRELRMPTLGLPPSEEQIKNFEEFLKRELCKPRLPRGEGKKRKAKGEGKKGQKELAAA